jgi:hypothetical protein
VASLPLSRSRGLGRRRFFLFPPAAEDLTRFIFQVIEAFLDIDAPFETL